jgi:D-alanyl-D-alanine carboxypeptidase
MIVAIAIYLITDELNDKKAKTGGGSANTGTVTTIPDNKNGNEGTTVITDNNGLPLTTSVMPIQSESTTPTVQGQIPTPSTQAKANVQTQTPASTPKSYPAPPIDPQLQANGNYVNGILIANKTYALPADYSPGEQSIARNAFNDMQTAAKADNVKLWIKSGFRSYSYQKQLYDNYVSRDGKEKADTYSARPGHSEHQTGLAFDINTASSSDNFQNTKEGKWLAKNAHKFGFILRYQEGKMDITGYKYEPWHFRYVGSDVAAAVYSSGKTLEEYLGITSAYAN